MRYEQNCKGSFHTFLLPYFPLLHFPLPHFQRPRPELSFVHNYFVDCFLWEGALPLDLTRGTASGPPL